MSNRNEIIRKELARRELARRDLLSFIKYFREDYNPGWAHIEICRLLDAFIEAIRQNGSPRIMISLPPRFGKSTIVSEYFPAYMLGLNSNWEIINTTYNQTVADNMGRKVRDILQNQRYQDLFNVQLDPRSQSAEYVKLATPGFYRSTGIGGSLTSLGTHCLIIDDPIKDRAQAESQIESDNQWDWYSSTARTRLHPGAGIVVVQTRWAVNDLSGRLIDAAARDSNADQWKVFNFPALAEEDEPHRKKGEALHPERYSREDYIRIKATVEPRDWAALYQGKPYVESGAFFQKDNIKFYKDLPEELSYCLGADYATSASKKSDKSAIVGLGITHDGDIYVHPDFKYDWLDPWDAVDFTIQYAKTLRARDLGGESGPIQNTMGSIFQRVQAEHDWYVTINKNVRRTTKAIAANTMRALMSAGKLHFPDTHRMRTDIVPELLRFDPRVDRGGDDFIDAIVNGLLLIETIGRPAPPIPATLPSWRKPGAVYAEDIFKPKHKTPAIPGLTDDW